MFEAPEYGRVHDTAHYQEYDPNAVHDADPQTVHDATPHIGVGHMPVHEPVKPVHPTNAGEVLKLMWEEEHDMEAAAHADGHGGHFPYRDEHRGYSFDYAQSEFDH